MKARPSLSVSSPLSALRNTPDRAILRREIMSPKTLPFIDRTVTILCATVIAFFACAASSAQQTSATHRTKIIIDSDIGDDVDDVFAIGLALTSREVEILGISSAWGDTQLRARMLDRLLLET